MAKDDLPGAEGPPASEQPAENEPAAKKPAAKKPGPKRPRNVGNLEQLKKQVWQTISTAEEIVVDPDVDNATRLRAIHALVQATGAFTRLIDFTEQSERMTKLEAEFEAMKGELGVGQ
jgi:hypothetical protein